MTAPLLQAAPEDVDVLRVPGLLAQQERDIDQALPHLLQAARLAPARADV